MPSLVLAELIEGHDLYEVEGFAMAIPDSFSDFVSGIQIDYNEPLGDYDVKQLIKE